MRKGAAFANVIKKERLHLANRILEGRIDMLKMMKYEFRRGVFPLMVVVIAITAVELLFLSGIALSKDVMVALGMGGLVIGAWLSYMFVLVYGIISYSRDLKNKSGYLVFMAPVSSFQIIGAKLLSVLLTGILLVAYIVVMFVVDYTIFCEKYEIVTSIKEVVNSMLGATMGVSLANILFALAVLFLVILLQFYTAMSLAYFAVTLASTVLQNKKIKGVVSFVLFAVFYGLVNYAAMKLPTIGKGLAAETFLDAMYAAIPQLCLYGVCLIVGYLASAFLLEKKVSL